MFIFYCGFFKESEPCSDTPCYSFQSNLHERFSNRHKFFQLEFASIFSCLRYFFFIFLSISALKNFSSFLYFPNATSNELIWKFNFRNWLQINFSSGKRFLIFKKLAAAGSCSKTFYFFPSGFLRKLFRNGRETFSY